MSTPLPPPTTILSEENDQIVVSDDSLPLPEKPLSIAMTQILDDVHKNHHSTGDFTAYRQFCTRKLSRLKNRAPQSSIFTSSSKPSSTSQHLSKNARSRSTFVKREVTVGNCRCVEGLEIVLYLSERAKVKAMELKQSNNSQSTYLKNLKKSVKAAELLKDICCTDGLCTSETRLESIAYCNSITSFYNLESENFNFALVGLKACKSVYEVLGRLGTCGGDGKEMFSRKVKDIEPSVRYCLYNLNIGGGSSVKGDETEEEGDGEVKSLIDRFINECNVKTLQGNSGEGDGEDKMSSSIKVSFRNSVISIQDDVIEAKYTSIVDITKTLSNTSSSNSSNERFNSLINAYNDITTTVNAKINKLGTAGDTIETKSTNLNKFNVYIFYLKLNSITKRVPELLTSLTNDEERFNLYSGIVKSCNILQTLLLSSSSDGDDNIDQEDDISFEINAHSIAYRAFKLYHLALIFERKSKFKEALELIETSLDLASESVQTLGAHEFSNELDDNDDDEAMSAPLVSFNELLNSLVEFDEIGTGFKCRIQAKLYLSKLDESTGGVDNNLLERLDTFSSCKNSDGVVQVYDIAKVQPIHVKSNFFDLSGNYVEYPLLVEEKKKKVGGMFSGWFGRN